MIVEHGVLDQGFRPTASVQEAIEQARGCGGVAWVGIQDPTEAEAEPVLIALDLDRRAVQFARRRRGHPGFVALRGHLLITLVELDEGGRDQAPIALEALVGPDHVVAVLYGGGHDAVTGLRSQVEERLDELALAGSPSGWSTLAALLLLFFDRYGSALDGIEDAVQGIGARLFPEPDEALVEDVYRTSQRVLRAGQGVRPLAHGLAEAASNDRLTSDAAFSQAVLRLRTVAFDLAERVTWAERTLTSLAQTLAGLSGQRSNELAARQAAVAQRISAYALLFAIPNAVFALYGVNFEHLPRLLTRTYGYPIVLALTAILVGLVAWRLRRSGWL